MIKSIINSKVIALEISLREDYPELYRDVTELIKVCKHKALKLASGQLEINIWTAAKLIDYIQDEYVDEQEINPEWIPVPRKITQEECFDFDPNCEYEQSEPHPVVNFPLVV